MKKLLLTLFALATISVIAMLGATSASAATSGTTGDCTWTLDGTVLTINGNGNMKNYSYSSISPWGQSITEVIIEDGVTSIGEYAFYGCSGLTSITIPDSVTSIGDYAFASCSSLTSITIPDGVTSIGEYAFAWCSSLTSITVSPDNSVYYSQGNCLIEKESGMLILGCNTSVIPSGVTSIGDSAFSNCSSLTSINIPDGVTSIGDSAFLRCSSLMSITIPDSVTSIGEYAFYGCSSLTSVYVRSPQIASQLTSTSACGYLVNHATEINILATITDVPSYVTSQFQNRCKRNVNGVTYTTYSSKDTHVYDNACDTACNTCGYTRTTTHSYKTTWDKNSSQHWHQCSVCGAPDEKINHQFGNAMDENCDVCGYTRQVQTTPSATDTSGNNDSNGLDTTTVIIIAVCGVAVLGLGMGGGVLIGTRKKK